MADQELRAPVRGRTHGPPPLRAIVDHARRAPSIHNTQPWGWRLRDDRLELYADRTRQLPVTDASGRNLLISCGAALEYARVAAAALGWTAEVEPADPRRTDHVATLRLAPACPTPAAEETFRLFRARATDRRRFTSWPIPVERLERLAQGASAPGVTVVPVTDHGSRIRVELVAREAQELERILPGFDEEQRSWVDRGPVDGVPAETLATDRHRDRRPTRFDDPGGAATGDVRSSDGVLVLCTDEDGPEAWVSTGRLLCRLWALADKEGLSVVPLSQPIEIPRTREALAGILGGVRRPQLVLRVGWQEIARSPLRTTPRRPVSDVLLD